MKKYFKLIGIVLFLFPFISFASTSTFGFTGIGGTNGPQVSGYPICTSAIAGADGTLQSISNYYGGIIGGGKVFRTAIYDDSSNAPFNLLASSVSTTLSSGWNTATLSTSIASGTKYWLCVNNNDATAGHALSVYDAGSSNQTQINQPLDGGNPTFSNPFSWLESHDWKVSIYGTINLSTSTNSTSSCYGNCIMSTSTDAIIGNILNSLYLIIWATFFFVVFYTVFKITKR